ncbi:DUF4031 domain-containing protein [Brachybacterium hainanense]|uniref:DUF4031 domain-containing protein n=1 Tax=Brachybacterium hainanense TaxID=1541174 RepID=A0ABV6RGR6_9MICO
MTLFADTPRWDNHGTVWGHLISDVSLEELHAGALRAGLSPRAFDLDHYDWPVDLRGRLEGAGVRMVGNRELTRILIRSGLRVPQGRRARARAERSAADAARLGLAPVPRDFIWGPRGHADPLPVLPGAFRISQDDPSRLRIQAHDGPGEAAAAALLARVDALARAAGHPFWQGQAMDAPRPS